MEISYFYILLIGIIIGITLERKLIKGGWSSKTFERLNKMENQK